MILVLLVRKESFHPGRKTSFLEDSLMNGGGGGGGEKLGYMFFAPSAL